MLLIYTHSNNPFTKEFWKWIAKKILRKYSGGLMELKIPFKINPLFMKNNSIVHVLSGVKILEEMIQKKQSGLIKTLITGPTMVMTPFEQKKILLNKNIDAILVPSKWVADFYISLCPTLKNVHIWPSGVCIPKEESNKNGKILIYKKNIDQNIYNLIINILKNNKISFEEITYKKFSHQYYLNKLKQTPLVIYLQTSESQGIALQEAWAHNVPTLVYQNTTWSNKDYIWTDEKISAPYLNEETGLFFTYNNFFEKFKSIQDKKINPKIYCSQELSDKKSVEILFDIIKKYEKTH